MRPLFGYLRTVTVPTAVFAAGEDWAGGGPTGALSERVDRAAGELADLMAARPASTPADPFADVVSFDALRRSL
jgi:FMN reductase